MKILILGSSGFLGSYLFKNLQNIGHHVSTVQRELWNQETSNSLLESVFSENDMVINCIAETDFNKCDDSNGFEANVGIPNRISYFINKYNLYCIHISTDAMYESIENNSDENSILRTSNSYVIQKRKGEIALQGSNTLILRTSFIGKNPRELGMIDYLLSSIKLEKKISGWNNVFTSSVHISDIFMLIDILIKRPQVGIYNFGTDTAYSKFDLLNEIMLRSNYHYEVSSIQAPLDSRIRNLNCGMLSDKIKNSLGLKLPTFYSVVNKCLIDIQNDLKKTIT